MKKIITILLLSLTLFSCTAEDNVVPQEPPVENPVPPTPTQELHSGCYFIHFVNYTGVYHYTKKIYGDPATYMLSYSSPLPQNQLEQWICP